LALAFVPTATYNFMKRLIAARRGLSTEAGPLR
jgi:hypothetical protein